MITGDQVIIAKEVARRLKMNRTILDARKFNPPDRLELSCLRDVASDGQQQLAHAQHFNSEVAGWPDDLFVEPGRDRERPCGS